MYLEKMEIRSPISKGSRTVWNALLESHRDAKQRRGGYTIQLKKKANIYGRADKLVCNKSE